MNINTMLRTSAGNWLFAASILVASCSGSEHEKVLENYHPISVQEGVPFIRASGQIAVSGQIEAEETAIIGTRVMGFVSSIKVKSGDTVRKGQLLMVIRSEDIAAKRAQAQAMIAETEAAFEDAQKDFDRYTELHKQQSASTKEFENVTLRYNSMKAKLEATQQMKNETEAMLSYANLVAPFSGTVTQKNIDEGSIAGPGMSLLVIENQHSFQVRAFVPESEVGKLKSGMSAEIIVKSTGKRITGRLVEISPSSQLTAGQFQVKITVPTSENDGLFSGMYVNVSIALENDLRTQSLYVPASALIHKDQLAGLYTIGEDQTAQLRWVKTGQQYDDEVEILSGLSASEKFIIQSEGRLYNGAQVQVKQMIIKTDSK